MTVNGSGPCSVIRTVCSNCAERPPSFVRTVQPSRLLCTPVFDAGVDHRLDGEHNSRLQALAAGLGGGHVRNRRRLMEIAADAMADVFFDNAEALLLRMPDNRVANVRNAAVRLKIVDRQPEAIESTLHDAAGQVGGRADDERLARIAVPAVDDRGQIDVDDVAVVEQVVRRELRGK